MKIGLTGTVSVGKTTLINALAELEEFKDYKIATERSKYLRDLGIPLNTDSTLKGQTIFMAERVSELFNNNLLTDRTILDVMAFTLSADSIPLYQKRKFIDYSSQFIGEYDYIFYIPTDGVNIEDNGVRTIDPEYRNEIDTSIKLLLDEFASIINNKMVVITGTTEERISQIMNVIKN